MPFVAPTGQSAQPLPVPRDTAFGTAFDINNLGEIVGRLTVMIRGGFVDAPYAYLWKDGDMINLEKQIDRKSGWDRLWGASVINDAGIIAGYGRFDVERRGFLLIPNEP
jgi:probable HAF family extracellular repeat protein